MLVVLTQHDLVWGRGRSAWTASEHGTPAAGMPSQTMLNGPHPGAVAWTPAHLRSLPWGETQLQQHSSPLRCLPPASEGQAALPRLLPPRASAQLLRTPPMVRPVQRWQEQLPASGRQG